MSEREIRELIQATLANAARAPYYARAWGDAWRDVRTVDDLAALPLLDKATAIANQRDLVVGVRPAGFGVASSGTTRTADLPALNVLRSDAEHRLLGGDDVGDEPRDGAGGDAGDGARGSAPVGARAGAPDEAAGADDPYPGWTLVAVGVHHGLPRTAPRADELFVPWSYHRNALSMLAAVCGEPQPDGRRVTALRISAGALKTFACWLLETGRDPASLGVKLIGTNGSRVSTFWRARIAELFGATLYDNFSLSEVPTVATECKACGGLHFGWPPLLYEVLDLLTGRPLARGTGRLVLTPLFPWVQTMPLVRYDTGDVVELGDTCAAADAPILRYRGRLRRGVVDGDGRFLLAPADVQDALEASPETERNPHPAATNGLVRSRELGLPRWIAERIDEGAGAARARLTFEARFDPLVYAARARRLADDVAAQLVAAGSPAAIEVRVAPPGTLSPPGDKFE